MSVIRRMAVLLLTALCGTVALLPAAAADFSPAWTAMTEAYADRHEPIRAALSIRCESISGVPDALTAKVNAWLEGSSVLFESRIRDEHVTEEHVKADFDGETALDCWIREETAQSLTVFDGARGYLTDQEVNAYEAAAGLGGLLVPGSSVPDFFLFEIMPRVYDLLELNGAAVAAEEESVRLGPAGKSVYQTRYALTSEQMDLLWPGILSLWKNGLQNALSLSPDLCDSFSSLLSLASFPAQTTVLRLFDGQGRDMGLRVTGRCRPGDGSTRKMTLTAAFRKDSGLYIDLSLPASKGSWSDQWTLKITFPEAGAPSALKLEGSVSRKDAGGSVSLKLGGEWSNRQGETEHITGGMTLSGQAYGVDRSWSLDGDLDLKYGFGEGVFHLARTAGGTNDTRVTVFLQLGMGGMETMPECAAVTDLRGYKPERIRNALSREALGLSMTLLSHLDSLEYAEWAALLHAFRNDTWMESRAVESSTESEYTVIGTETEWSVNPNEEIVQ